METVFATQGGSRFHKTTICESAERARLIYDSDEFTARSHPWESATLTDAMGSGKEACTTCFPGLRAAWYSSGSENDFGHEPFTYDGVTICARCYVIEVRCSLDAFELPHRVVGRRPVAWPCTSAIVLGLAPRTVADRTEAAV